MKTLVQLNRSHRTTTRIRSTLIMGALLGGSLLAVAAPDDMAATPSNAASQTGQAVSDTWITTKVKSEIMTNSISKGFQVSVTTKQGIVALEGRLPSQEAVDFVKSLSSKVTGVRGVDTTGLIVSG